MATRAGLMWRTAVLLWRLLGWLCTPLLLCSGRLRWQLRKLAIPAPGAIWIHGASLGEHQLVQALSAELEAEHSIWRTHSTMRTKISDSFPAPLDLPWIIERWVKQARPRMLILVEAELWPGWIEACRQRDIPVVVINLPSHSKQRLQRWGLWNHLQRLVQIFDQQSYGDLKLAIPPKRHPRPLPQPYIIAASTRDGKPADEERLLEVWRAHNRSELLVLAPRRVERAAEILAQCSPLPAALWSQWSGEDIAVLVIDTVGDLTGWIPDAEVVFIGGTFSASIGGHSPAAALAAGVPVIAGPHRRGEIWKSIPMQQLSSSEALHQALNQPALSSEQRSLQPVLKKLPLSTMAPKEALSRPLLRPLTALWQLWGAHSQNYQPTKLAPAVPTISVGALTAGGSGKTPVTALLAERLQAWVISHGYKRPKAGREPRLNEDLGDEALMLKRQGLQVISSPDRCAGIQLAQQKGATSVVLDDAFQHRRAPRTLDIVCIDCRHPHGGGVIPVGRAREKWSALERADCIWLHEWTPHLPLPALPEKTLVRSKMVPKHWLHKGKIVPLQCFAGQPKVVCGLAVPGGFLSILHQLHVHLEEWRLLKDHEPLPEGVEGWICSEKDAARLTFPEKMWVLVCQISVLDEDSLKGLLHAFEAD